MIFYRFIKQLFFRDRHIEHVRRLHIYLSRTTGHLSSHFHTYAIHKRCFPDLEKILFTQTNILAIAAEDLTLIVIESLPSTCQEWQKTRASCKDVSEGAKC
jgi:hypothetical protein